MYFDRFHFPRTFEARRESTPVAPMAFVALIYGQQTSSKRIEPNLYANVLARRSSVARRILVGRARTRREVPSDKLMPLSCSAVELLQQNLPHR
jgi:hypothetical protein